MSAISSAVRTEDVSAGILVISRNSAVLRPLRSMAEATGWKIEIAADSWEAAGKLKTGAIPDLLLLDLSGGDSGRMYIVRRLRRLRPALPVILIGQSGAAHAEEESARMNAREYLEGPLDDRQLKMAIQRNLRAPAEAAEIDLTSDDVEPIGPGASFIGVSPVMQRLRARAALLAETNLPVLVVGEGGSGRETTARLIHKLSVQSAFEFGKVDCAALLGDLLEKELFGCERAGTAAPAQTRRGKLEFCAKGTLFLDNVTEMPPDLQDRLLDALRSGRFIRPGTSTAVEAEVRVLAACAPGFERMVSGRRSRENLCQYLSVQTIFVPPLRERREEIPFLARHFMHRLSGHYGLPSREFSPAILGAWDKHDWPGNLRELERAVKRYFIVGDKELAFEKSRANAAGESADRGSLVRNRDGTQSGSAPGQSRSGVAGFESLRSLIRSVRSEAERNAIATALEKTGWNRKAAARLLKVSYRTMLYKIQQYHMSAADSPVPAGAGGPEDDGGGFRDDIPGASSSPRWNPSRIADRS
jgi:two-component system NtrC family response regulator